MQRRTFKKALGLALTLAALCAPQLATAQAWPAKQPIKFVAVFPPGGSVDQVARILAQQLSTQIGQSVIVENRGGASGAIGTAAVAQSAPDGYTFAMVFDTHGVNPALNPNLPYDTKKDLIPLVLVGTSPMVLATHVGSEYKTFKDVVDAAKAKKNVSFGTIGNGSLGHLAMALLGKDANMEMTHIPYKGGGPLSTDGIAGHVPVTLATYALWAPHLASGRLRALAVTSPKRMPQLPDVPTVSEQGLPEFEAQAWWGMLGPAGIPAEIVARMNAEMAKVLKIPAVQERLTQMGVQVTASSPDEFGKFVRGEVERWSKVVRENNIKAGQ